MKATLQAKVWEEAFRSLCSPAGHSRALWLTIWGVPSAYGRGEGETKAAWTQTQIPSKGGKAQYEAAVCLTKSQGGVRSPRWTERRWNKSTRIHKLPFRLLRGIYGVDTTGSGNVTRFFQFINYQLVQVWFQIFFDGNITGFKQEPKDSWSCGQENGTWVIITVFCEVAWPCWTLWASQPQQIPVFVLNTQWSAHLFPLCVPLSHLTSHSTLQYKFRLQGFDYIYNIFIIFYYIGVLIFNELLYLF